MRPTITSHQPPTTNYQPPTTNHQPPTTNHQLPTISLIASNNHEPVLSLSHRVDLFFAVFLLVFLKISCPVLCSGPEEDRTMWAVQDLSRLLHCIATWACRKYGLRCLHLAIRLGGGGNGAEGRGSQSPPLGTYGTSTTTGSSAGAGAGAAGSPSVVVAVDGGSDPAQAAQASAFVNRELNDVLVV